MFLAILGVGQYLDIIFNSLNTQSKNFLNFSFEKLPFNPQVNKQWVFLGLNNTLLKILFHVVAVSPWPKRLHEDIQLDLTELKKPRWNYYRLESESSRPSDDDTESICSLQAKETGRVGDAPLPCFFLLDPCHLQMSLETPLTLSQKVLTAGMSMRLKWSTRWLACRRITMKSSFPPLTLR